MDFQTEEKIRKTYILKLVLIYCFKLSKVISKDNNIKTL